MLNQGPYVLGAVIAVSIIMGVVLIIAAMRGKVMAVKFASAHYAKEEQIQEVLAAWQRLSNGLNHTFYSGKVPPDKAMAEYLMKALPATMAGMDKAVVDLVKK